MLTFKDITFQYNEEDFSIIDNLSFHVNQGEFVSIVGPSGCGKSTIFRLVNRLMEPKSGEILVNGVPVGSQKHYCGYMPQQDMLFPWRSVAENVRLPLEIQGSFCDSEMDLRVKQALAAVGLEDWGGKAPKELSGGMRQRAAFARTVLTGSNLLLLDEPFSALDYLTRLTMREWLLQQWERERKTILFITHDVEEALFLSGRVLVAEGTPITQLRTFEVPAGYPRTPETLRQPEILALKEQMIAILRRDRL